MFSVMTVDAASIAIELDEDFPGGPRLTIVLHSENGDQMRHSVLGLGAAAIAFAARHGVHARKARAA